MANIYDAEQGKLILDKSLEKDLDRLDKDPYTDLAKQCQAEYDLTWDHQNGKIKEHLLRLKIYNNQRRKKDDAGDTTMFTIHQTVLASLYVDQLMAEFAGREEGDEGVAENLNPLAQFDYDEMQKDILDYDWDWDTTFFGRGLLECYEYLRDPENQIFLPVPEVIDPTTFLRDPRGVAINGNTRTGKNACRFFGREIRMTREAMEADPNFFISDWKNMKFGTGMKDLMEDAHQARANAQGLNYGKFLGMGEDKLGVNGEYSLTKWFTHWTINGDVRKVIVYLANQRKLVVGLKDLGPALKTRWKVYDRPLYPTSHDWDGTSIPDLTEDKQRHRAVAQNLGMRAMTADLYPNYIYDQNKVKNRNDLNFGFNKFIPVDGDPTAILPMRKAAPNMGLLDFIYTSLDMSAQKATATPELQQGIQSQKDRPLGETNLLASKVDTRYSLSAKVFGWSERAFWKEGWYGSYKENFEGYIDEKVIRVAGAFGDKWRPLTKAEIVANLDPDVKIESKVLSRARQLEERQNLTQYFTLVLADPTANRRYAYRKLGRLNGLQKDELDRLLPPTIDERQAEDENEFLSENKSVPVRPEDDHNVHLEMHAKAKWTKATEAHVETHKHALSIKRVRPELFPTAQQDQAADMNPPGTEGAPKGMAPGMARPVTPSQTSGVGIPMMQ